MLLITTHNSSGLRDLYPWRLHLKLGIIVVEKCGQDLYLHFQFQRVPKIKLKEKS